MNDTIRSAVPAAHVVWPAENLPPVGAHLMTPRLGYTHHGIHVGGGKVVHYAGLSRTLFRGPVEVVSLARFAGGRKVIVKPEACAAFEPEDVVRRAFSRLGEDRYQLTSNNCEHFCEWCRWGENRSAQVDRIVRPVRLVAQAAQAAAAWLRGTFGGQRALPA